MQKKILIVITGSIASYKTLYLIRKLKEKHFFINVIMSKSAKEFNSSFESDCPSSNALSNKDVFGIDVSASLCFL